MRFLGIDIGTTRMKCGVYNEEGTPEYFDSVDYGEVRKGKESYIDIDKILSCALALLKKAYAACPFDTVAVSSLGESFVLLDEEDRPVFYPMLYTDPRGKEEAEEQMVHAEEIFRIAGVYPQGMYSAYKLMWIKRHAPEAYGRAKKALLVNEFLSYQLTGIRAIDCAQAARSGLFDVRTKQFSKELCQLFDLDAELFSPAVPSGSIVGPLKEELAEDWGVSSPVYVVAGAHDQVCAALGSGATSEDCCSDGMGTVECITAIYNTPSVNTEMGRAGYPIVPFLDRAYCTYLLNYSCGSLTRWWLSQCYREEEIKSGKAFGKIEKDFADSPTGILVLPYFGGAATPYQNIDAKGAILNLSVEDSPSRVYQGILEGLCYEMRLNLEMTRPFGIAPRRLVATGGGSSSRRWLQIKADILGIPVYPLQVSEAGICGAAMLGASALLHEEIGEVAKRFVKLGDPLIPRQDVREAYDREYQKYKKIYETVKVFY